MANGSALSMTSLMMIKIFNRLKLETHGETQVDCSGMREMFLYWTPTDPRMCGHQILALT